MKNIWDDILTDDEWVKKIKELATGPNPTVALAACKLVGEGKGYKTGLTDMTVEEITFKGLDDDIGGDDDIQKLDKDNIGTSPKTD